MSEMIERVARALCKQNGTDPETEITLPLVSGKNWTLYQASARIAIETMREPTEAMVTDEVRSLVYPEDAWGIMIGEALK